MKLSSQALAEFTPPRKISIVSRIVVDRERSDNRVPRRKIALVPMGELLLYSHPGNLDRDSYFSRISTSKR